MEYLSFEDYFRNLKYVNHYVYNLFLKNNIVIPKIDDNYISKLNNMLLRAKSINFISNISQNINKLSNWYILDNITENDIKKFMNIRELIVNFSSNKDKIIDKVNLLDRIEKIKINYHCDITKLLFKNNIEELELICDDYNNSDDIIKN